MAKQIDARGLSCPEPVIRTRAAIEKGDSPLEVLVDSVTARENVRRAVKKMGRKISIEETEGEIKLIVT